MTNLHHNNEAAGVLPAASTGGVQRIHLTKPMLRELRLQLLGYSSPFSVELELVEERYDSGDIVVRLARPDKRERGEIILGCRDAGCEAAR
jgi:hypothetical protein